MTSACIYMQKMNNHGMKHAQQALEKINAGSTGKERPVQGLLEQWLQEGKMSDKEALMTSADMFAAGADSVSQLHAIHV